MKRFIACSIACIITNVLFAAELKYPVLFINDSLTKNASIVKRYDELVIEIKSPGKARLYKKYAYTILNEDGVGYAGFIDAYNKFRDIGSVDGTLYDAMGKELKSVKKRDMQDLSGNDESSLMSDTRYKRHDFYYRTYPFTVAYEEEVSLDGVFDLPDWYAQQSIGVSVEDAKLVVIAPKNYTFRYKNINYNSNPVITESGDKKTYTWQVKNLKAIKWESYMPPIRDIASGVLVAPSDFEIQGYKGNMQTWLGFGQFINSLLAGKDVLPDAVKQQVHTLTDGLKNSREKVNVLYDFLQKNTRYISIQLGIGGWQPFDAAYVTAKRYGDCKALSNYMVALLKEAGIPANYVLIKAGDDEDDMIEDFPGNQFNHATVCVPMPKDSIWLECTSQTVSPGYIGDFTGNRKALLIDEKGGHVVFTKHYEADKNQQIRKITGVIDETGKLTADIETNFTCLQQDDLHGMINGLTRKQVMERLQKMIDLPTYEINTFNYKENRGEMPAIDETLKLDAINYANISGKRIFVTPNVLSRNTFRLRTDSARLYDIVYNYAFTDVDTVQLTIPAGYTLEALPKNSSISNEFGAYETSLKVEGTTILYIRKYKRNDGRFPPAAFQKMGKFYDEIYKADRARIVFVKKDA